MGFYRQEPISEQYLDYAEKLEDGRWYYAYKRDKTFNCIYGHAEPPEKRIIVVLADGQHAFDEFTFESFARYASKINVSLHIMREFTDVNELIHWEKMRIFNWLLDGYRVLYLDHDTYITKACPNLFDLVPNDRFAAVDEVKHFWPMNASERRVYSAEIGRMLGKPLPRDYDIPTRPIWQAGVFLASPCHAQVFLLPQDEEKRKILADWPLSDQSWMNYKLMYHRVKMQSMPREFNCMRPTPGESPWIVHAAGVDNKDRPEFLASWDGQ